MIAFLSDLPPELYDAIGVAGFGLYVLNYSLLTFHKVRSEQAIYFAVNWLAASMVLIGLINAFNLAAALIQIFWILISSVGLVIRLRKKPDVTPSFETHRAL